jgi:anti-anti-sigma regulatory factor
MNHWLDPAPDSGALPPLRATLWLSGDVDLADAASLEFLGRDVQTLTRLHVDLGEVRWFGAGLMGWLLSVQQSLARHGGKLTLGRVSPRGLHVLTLGGLQGSFESSPSPDSHPRQVLHPAA